jgi:hypothetical protein
MLLTLIWLLFNTVFWVPLESTVTYLATCQSIKARLPSATSLRNDIADPHGDCRTVPRSSMASAKISSGRSYPNDKHF